MARWLLESEATHSSSSGEGEAGLNWGDPDLGGEHLGAEPRVLGDYQLVQEIGHGGMGVVYRARHVGLARWVALKVLLLGPFSSPAAVQRFLREARAAAQLRHPGIVPVYDIGECAGQRYYTMELVEGRSLAQILDDGPLEPRRAARYVRSLAEAVEYAHAHGVLHRDLKPANVLLDASDQPRITDFGVAKCLDDPARVTMTGEMVGSPAYLSPEQAWGGRGEVDGRSDVYALGAILYEALTGRPPFMAASVAETLAAIRDRLPVSPRRLNPAVGPDLAAVVLRCLEKDPHRRYASAGDLAADLVRYGDGRPTLARPVGGWGRFHRWVRRKPREAAVLAVAVAAALGATVISIRLARAEAGTRNANARLEASLRRFQWREAEDALDAGRTPEAIHRFGRLLREQPEDRALAARLVSLLSHRRYAQPVSRVFALQGPIAWGELDEHGQHLVTAGLFDAVRVWDVATGAAKVTIDPQGRGWLRASFLQKARPLVTLGDRGDVSLWNLETGMLIESVRAEPGTTPGLDVEVERGALAWIRGRDRFAWTVVEDGLRGRQDVEISESPSVLRIAPGGRSLAVGTIKGSVLWYDAGASGLRFNDRFDAGDDVVALEFSPDGKDLVVGTRRGRVHAVSASQPSKGRFLGERRAEASILRWSPDGTQVAVGWFGDWPEIWDIPSFRRVAVVRGPASDVTSDMIWMPDGKSMVIGYRSGTVLRYDITTLRPLEEPFEHQGPISRLVMEKATRRLLTTSHDGTARLWKIPPEPSEERFESLPGRVDGEPRRLGHQALVPVHQGSRVQIFDLEALRPVGEVRTHTGSIHSAVLSPDGGMLLVVGAGATLWSIADGKPMRVLEPDSVRITASAWAPDSSWCALATADGEILRWTLAAGALSERQERWPCRAGITGLTISPSGRWLAAQGSDAAVHRIDTHLTEPCDDVTPLRHWGRIWSVDFRTDSQRLVTASVDRTVRVWDVDSGVECVPTMRHDHPVLVAKFSPDDRVIASGSEDRTVRLWDAQTGAMLTPPLKHSDRVWLLEFTAHGRHLVTGSDRGEVRVWEVRSGLPISESVTVGGPILRLWVTADGTVLSITHRGAVSRYRYPWTEDHPPRWLADLAVGFAGGPAVGSGPGLRVEVPGASAVAAGTGEGGDFYDAWRAWILDSRPAHAPPPWDRRETARAKEP